MATPLDFHVQFDAVNALKYYHRIATIIASVVGIVLAVITFQYSGGDATFAGLMSDSIDGFDAQEGTTNIALFALLPILIVGVLVLVLLLVVAPSLLRKTLDAQRCTITKMQILSESGWLNRTTQVIPLDRIQDLSVKQGFLQQRFGLHTIEIQTAGSPSPFPEAVLYAPKDAQRVREEIMRRRDALLLGKARASASASVSASASAIGHSTDDAVITPLASAGDQLVDALAELNRTMLRIERLLLSKDAAPFINN